MEDLSKNQIVLLTLLVSFVTSIATGIMTTSLLMEAPVEITQTINRVVEKTIETVVPEQVTDSIGKQQPTKEIVTVVVNEEDRVIDAIEKNSKSVVRIRARSSTLGVDNFYGLGVFVSNEGIIATDKKTISEVMEYVAIAYDGTEIPLVSVAVTKSSPVNFFLAKPKVEYKFNFVNLSSAEPKLGQSVLVIGGDTINAISTGRITTVNIKDNGSTTPKTLLSIEADITPKDLVYGAPLITLSGDVLGISLSDMPNSKTYFPASLLKKEISLIGEVNPPELQEVKSN